MAHHGTIHPVIPGFACTKCALSVAHDKRNFPTHQRVNKHDAAVRSEGDFVCTCGGEYKKLKFLQKHTNTKKSRLETRGRLCTPCALENRAPSLNIKSIFLF